MKSIKRINSFGGIPTHYIVYKDTEIIGMFKTKREAEEAMKEA